MGSIVSGVMSLAGGGGGAAPTADMSKNIANAQGTYDAASADATQTMNSAKALNAQSQNTLSNITGSNTAAMNNINDTSNKNLSTYGSSFTPLQAQQAQQAQNYTGEANTKQLQGQATADSNSAIQAARANSAASLAAEGVDPASVHGGALDAQAGIKAAAQNAGAMNNSYLQTQATGSQLTNQANQLGLQIGAQGTSGLATGAGIGSGIVSDTNNTNNSNINNMTAANSYLNTATGANNSGTNAQTAQFNANQATYQDNVAAAASKSAAVGGIASGVMSMMEAGGVVQPPSVTNIPGLARGGAVPVPSYGPVGINVTRHMAPLLRGTTPVPHLAGGGPITPRGALPYPIVPGTTDTKLIAATPGEFMLPKDVTDHMGHEKIHKMIDKVREDIQKRRGIPVGSAQLSSAHTSMGA